MSFNLVQLAQATLNEQSHLMAKRFDIDPSDVQDVIDALVPTLIASMLKKADSPEGAQDLYTSIASSRVDSNIAINLRSFFCSQFAVNKLVKMGTEQVTALIEEKISDLSQAVALQTRVDNGFVASMMGIVSATIYGLLKQKLRAHSGQQDVLLSALAAQIPHVKDSLSEDTWHSLGLGAMGAFFEVIDGKLNSTLSVTSFDTPEPRALVSSEKKSNGLIRWWWIWLLLAIIALMFVIRGPKTTEVATLPVNVPTPTVVMPVVPSQEPLFSLKTDKNGKATIVGAVGSESEKNAILDILNNVYGDAFTVDIKIDQATKPAVWLSKLGDLLLNFKLSNVDLTLKGSNINFISAAADAKLELLAKVKALFGADFNVSIFSMSEALAISKKQFEKSLTLLNTRACNAADVAKVLNTFSFNFVSGSAEIPKEDALLFAKSIPAVKACAKDAKLLIAGHTDNEGVADNNMALSLKRAESVRDFFVAKGIAGSALTTKAYGQTQPVGDNDTASGRFQNRRIEFSEHEVSVK